MIWSDPESLVNDSICWEPRPDHEPTGCHATVGGAATAGRTPDSEPQDSVRLARIPAAMCVKRRGEIRASGPAAQPVGV